MKLLVLGEADVPWESTVPEDVPTLVLGGGLERLHALSDQQQVALAENLVPRTCFQHSDAIMSTKPRSAEPAAGSKDALYCFVDLPISIKRNRQSTAMQDSDVRAGGRCDCENFVAM